MIIKKFLNFFNFFKLVNYYQYNLFYRKLFLNYYNKKKLILKNSYSKDSLLNRYFKKSLDINKFRASFFESNLFPYCNLLEKEELIRLLKTYCSDYIKDYLNHAEKILNKEVQIFDKNVKFSKKINWFFGFKDTFNWPIIACEKINIRPLENIDVKYVWELNRHQFFTYLGFAYYITGEVKYALGFKDLILDWIKNNPPLIGINWYSGLEISLRLTSWIFTLYFFKDCKEINNNKFFKLIFESMFQHAYFLRYFYQRRSFNHTIGDLFGVYFFSRTLKNIRTMKKWEKIFFKKFKTQIYLQIREDGTNIEQSINYHRFVLEFISIFLILNSDILSKNEKSLIEKMFDYTINIIKPDGNFPLIGDNDDGKVLLLSAYEKNPYICLINLGAILFKRGDFKYFSKNLFPISILLTGFQGLNTFNEINVFQPIEKVKFFDKSGYIVIKSDFLKDSSYLFVDFGRFGPGNAAHTHSNVSNIIFSSKGQDIIIDSGTYSYNMTWKERNYFKSSVAHNVLTINQKNQALIDGWFSWKNKPNLKRYIEFDNKTIELTCYHNGYKNFITKRKITTNIDLRKIIIEDSVRPLHYSTSEFFNIDIYFHFAHDIDLKVENNEIITNKGVKMKIFSNENFKILKEKSVYSPSYGIKIDNNIVKIHLFTSLNNNKLIKIKTEINSLN